MLKLSQPITSINGFKIGDKVRLKDGDGRLHIIKSFSIDGMKDFFFEVQFEDGTETMLNNIAPFPSDLDDAAEKYAKLRNAAYETVFYAFKAGAEWMQNKMFSLRFENEPLDSAARNVFKEWIPMEVLTIDGIDGGIPLYNQGALIMMFDAGAEWMAGQGVIYEDAVVFLKYRNEFGFYNTDIDNGNKQGVCSDYCIKQLGLNDGDKVVVQIRKK